MDEDELEEKRNIYESTISDIDKLDREGIQVITPLEANKIKRRLREINSRFEQVKKPKDDGRFSVQEVVQSKTRQLKTRFGEIK